MFYVYLLCRTTYSMWLRKNSPLRRFAARVSGLAFSLALAVRPAGSAEAPGSRVGASAHREATRPQGALLTPEGPTRTMRGVPVR
jgi:hypothetical protein